ncbi:hypothetical protein PQR25_00095 [Paraburkholderia nemoris]|uniref:ApeA N-terminal domain 1-containing protein n=1 Tax=Paraburkholderia nemoris TaxID=2793076 RepID=UPI0038B6F483
MDWAKPHMNKVIDELQLKKSYYLDVTVQNNGTHFVGKLSLTPSSCGLTISGDILDDRRPEFDRYAINQLACDHHGATLILFDLKGRGGNFWQVTRHPKLLSHFEITYEVSYVIYSRSSLSGNSGYFEIEFDSTSIARWIGYTKSQDDIVAMYNQGTLFPYPDNLPAEFEQALENIGKLSVCYYPSTSHSVADFSMGLHFAPMLTLSFIGNKAGAQAIECLNEIRTVFSFLIGEELDLNAVRLTMANGRMRRASMYFPNAQTNSQGDIYPWFPLGKNLRIDHMGLPEFPSASFDTYFKLSEQERLFFKKYLKYRSLENPEERFLGYFRLLEKVCHEKASYLPSDKLEKLLRRVSPFIVRYFSDKKNVESLLERVIHVNTLKLNAASFIGKLLKRLPVKLTSRWVYKRSDINAICKLRNDLTHANELEPDELGVENKAKFIEVLLVVSLLEKIGVPLEVGARIAPRLKRYHLIEKPVSPVISVRAPEAQP